MAEDDEACLRLQPVLRKEAEARSEDRSAEGEREGVQEEPTSHPAVARPDCAEHADRGGAVRERPRLSRMDPKGHEDLEETGDPVRHDGHGGRRLGPGRREIVAGRPAESGPEDEIRNPFVCWRIARDVRPREVRPAHVHARTESPEERGERGGVRRPQADRMKRGRAQAGKESSHREVDEHLIVCRRRRAIDSRDVDERNPRDRRADQRRVLPRRQPESAHEAFSRVHGSISNRSELNPFTALEGEERPRFCGSDDDWLAADGPEAQDLRAHELSPRLRGEILREALVDRVGPAPLRDEVRVAREDPSRHAREGRKDRPRGPEQERAEEEAREGTRPDQDGTTPFVRTRTAARRDGTRPARTAARTETSRASTTAAVGGDKITRFGRPRIGANETTACAATIPSADPRTAPARARTIACAS